MNFPSDTKVFLALGATDMRKAIDGLSIIVSEQMQLDIFSDHRLFFVTGNARSLKFYTGIRMVFAFGRNGLKKIISNGRRIKKM